MDRQPPSSRCVLASLADATEGDPVLGLSWRGGCFAAERGFGCCGGSGRRYDEAHMATVVCSLKSRLVHVRQVAASYYRDFGADGGELPKLLRPVNTAHLSRLRDISQGLAKRGLVLNDDPLGQGNLSLSLAAAWRFDLAVHHVTLGVTAAARLLPSGVSPKLMVVGNVTALWDERRAQDFELLVGVAYNAVIPVFLQFPGPAAAPSAGRAALSSRRQALLARVEKAKSRPVLAWLSASTRAKVRELTEGAPVQDEKKVQRRRPLEHRILPWD